MGFLSLEKSTDSPSRRLRVDIAVPWSRRPSLSSVDEQSGPRDELCLFGAEECDCRTKSSGSPVIRGNSRSHGFFVRTISRLCQSMSSRLRRVDSHPVSGNLSSGDFQKLVRPARATELAIRYSIGCFTPTPPLRRPCPTFTHSGNCCTAHLDHCSAIHIERSLIRAKVSIFECPRRRTTCVSYGMSNCPSSKSPVQQNRVLN